MKIHPMDTMCQILIASLGLVIASSLTADQSIELTPGVIVDLTEQRVYLMSPKSSVEAISSIDGELIWENSNAAKPLAKSGNTLLTQAESREAPNNLDLVVLDADAGELLSASPIALPSQVYVSIDDDLGSRFKSQAIAVDQEAFVSWDYQAFPRQGMVMLPGGDEDADGQAKSTPPPVPPPVSRTIKVDLSTGEASPVATGDLPPAAMMFFSPGTPKGADLDPRQRLSADGRHTLHSERVADDREWNKYQWSIIDNESGDHIGTIRSYLSQAPFVVVDQRTVVFDSGAYIRKGENGLLEQPRSIRAVDLKSGEEIWSRPVRDPAYRGTFPP